ncbi:putative monothiol glutaredoxin [Paramicrosporidium saccamoebae]|uniref:Putative monothiol glutaredoxin n=1 Tax=Paramicrosporidium saccamoebae TaxID=1246581 RepID=A0A2H9TFS0_9FUNG|nr:putative monothiol glutaredoxin [Paramicrosporidium saccamoebae]
MTIKNAISLDEVLLASKTEPGKLHVLNFWASWAEPCLQMNEIFAALAAAHPTISFWDVDAETTADISLHFMVEAVPTFVFLQEGQEVRRINGSKAEELAMAIEAISTPQDLDTHLSSLINRHKVMLFIKGTPTAPRCGFTRQLLSLLASQQVEYDYFDILADETVRQGLKEYSNWPTYPQVYIRGELAGGLDIVQEMIESGTFADTLND